MNKLFLFALTTLGMLTCLRCDVMVPLFGHGSRPKVHGAGRDPHPHG